MISIFIVIFWNFFRRCGNVLVLWRYNLFFHQIFRKKVMLLWAFFSSHPGSYKYTKKLPKNNNFFSSCRIDPYLYGKLLFIQSWFLRWMIWRTLLFGQSWYLLEKKTYDLHFWTQFSQFSKSKKLTFIRLLYTTLLPLSLIFFNSMLPLLAI
jgi:hypothetical protein